jgi:hypothetical protein
MTTENILKLTPAILAFLTALLRQIPRAAVAAREHGNENSAVIEDVRVLGYWTSPPWDKWLYGGLTNQASDQERLRKTGMRFTFGAGLVILAATIAYLVVAWLYHLPSWSYAFAVVLGLPAAVLILRRANQLSKNSDQVVKAPAGYVDIQGERGGVQQFCLAGLRQIGARLISAAEGPSGEWRIRAATGLALPGRIFLGELVEVEVTGAGKRQKVSITSRKVDWITPSRAMRNVATFLELWAAYSEKS